MLIVLHACISLLPHQHSINVLSPDSMICLALSQTQLVSDAPVTDILPCCNYHRSSKAFRGVTARIY